MPQNRMDNSQVRHRRYTSQSRNYNTQEYDLQPGRLPGETEEEMILRHRLEDERLQFFMNKLEHLSVWDEDHEDEDEEDVEEEYFTESDEEIEDLEDEDLETSGAQVDQRGVIASIVDFVWHFTWMIVLTCSLPIWLVLLLLRGDPPVSKFDKKWHLGCNTIREMLLLTFSNLISFASITYLAYCAVLQYPIVQDGRFRPFLFPDPSFPTSFLAQWNKLRTCLSPSDPLCSEMSSSILILIILAVVLLHFHTKLTKLCLILSFLAALTHVQYEQYQRWASRRIFLTSIDPDYALVNEPIQISIDGANLDDRVQLGWVPYWSCSKTTSLQHCPKEYVHPLSSGTISATFTQVDDYTPCVALRSDDEPLEYECFPDFRLRVKDKKSFPGWSLKAHRRGH